MATRGRPKLGAPILNELPDLLALWNRAIKSPRGIIIESERPNSLLQKLYATRRQVGGFHNLHLVETANEVWIIKRNPDEKP